MWVETYQGDLKVSWSYLHPPHWIYEDILVKVRGIYIPGDFIVVDIDEDSQVPILLGRPFLAIAGAIIDVKGGRIVFQVSDEMVGFEIDDLNKDPIDYSCCMIEDHKVKKLFLASSAQYDLFDPFWGRFLIVKLMTLNERFVGGNPRV